MRAVFIIAGVALIAKFHWVLYLFGAFLIITALKMAFEKDKKIQPEKNPVLKLLRRIMQVDSSFDGGKLFLKKEGRWVATPMFAVVLLLETTDVIFAVDSMPAVLAIRLIL